MGILQDIDKAKEVLLELSQQIQNGKKYFIQDDEFLKYINSAIFSMVVVCFIQTMEQGFAPKNC